MSSNANGNAMAVKATLSIIAAGFVACFVIHKRNLKRKQQSKEDVNPREEEYEASFIPSDDSDTFYNQLGISEENLPDHIRREIHKERQRKAKVSMISMKTPMYDNIYMLDQNREAICTISMKKAKWYIRKNIAEWSSPKDGSELAKEKDIKCIRLLFEHNGKTTKKDDESSSETLYLRSVKQNICV